MNIHSRVFGYFYILRRESNKVRVIGQTAQLLRSLLLFDHVTLHSIKFAEFEAFVHDLGVSSVVDLLKTNTLTIAPDFLLFTGDFTVKGQPRRSPEVFDIITARSVRSSFIHDNLEKLQRSLSISEADFARLADAIQATFPTEPDPKKYGQAAMAHAKAEFVSNSPSLRTAVASRLKRLYGFNITANDFNLTVYDEGRSFRAESNLVKLCRLTDDEVHSAILMSMIAVCELNLSFEDMQLYSSITGFRTDEMAILDARLRFMIQNADAAVQEERFRRIVTLLDLPEVPLEPSRFDVDRFLSVRTSSECLDFRNWLAQTSDWSDEQVVDHVKSLCQTFARHYQSVGGKTLRLLASTGIGLIPGFGTIIAAVQSALDTFLLDKVLRPSGAIAFLRYSYPSLFPE